MENVNSMSEQKILLIKRKWIFWERLFEIGDILGSLTHTHCHLLNISGQESIFNLTSD